MDDPWSSPWATDAPASEAHIIQDEAHTSVSSVLKISPTETSNKPATSPWGTDDNGWGDWTTQQRHADDTWTAPGADLDPWSQTSHVDVNAEIDRNEVSNNKYVDLPFDSDDRIDHGPASTSSTSSSQATKEMDKVSPSIKDSIPKIEHPYPASDSETAKTETSTPAKPSKVQDLVVMYNGMAKKARSATKLSAVEDYLATEGTSKLHEEFTSVANSAPQETNTTIAVDAQLKKDELDTAKDETCSSASESGDEATDDNTTILSDVEGSASSDAEHTTTAKPPQKVAYPVDLALLETLFPSTPAVNTTAEIIPDMIIDDSFTQVSQRKLWYRISRFGSVQKHDLGNDDNYKYITWQGSETRQKTIQIVRRWMEEDSIAGRVVLGKKAAAIGASMFNWDSSEPAVEIGTLLRQHRAEVEPALPRLDIAPKPVVKIEASDDSSAFAWATNAPMTPTDVVPVSLPPTLAPESPIASDVASSVSPPSSIWDEDSRPATAHRLSSTIPAVPSGLHISETVGDLEDEDDDDWGEMMSSPTQPADPLFTSFESSLKPDPFADDFTSSPPIPQQGWGFDDPEPFKTAEKPAPTQKITTTVEVTDSSPWSSDIIAASTTTTNIHTSIKPQSPTSHTTPALLEDRELTNILAAIPDFSYMLR
ncbi:hypothetical protein VHEMI00956 [[Torrubiella] hemipterigena]|uniref:Glucan 1, 4-alpha-glucosidase n=1 Tax=[Torrubiella] hemipterigena TaxID=1531966 RepID=A0A0A1SRT8_9HYPO|nr:hypothetical protein VHEMI00956 [[Torrubiella] hemipterigena]